MTLDSFLSQLNGVQPRGSRWSALCPVPAHGDTTPSLSISEGERGILLKCWAGCSVQEICQALGIQQKDLFFDVLNTDPQRRKAAAQDRERRRDARERHAEQLGVVIDAMREADSFIRSRHGVDISSWNDQQLDDELNALADAYHLLENEDLHGCLG